jgi:molybdopterin-containing oxidoreductase family iron-sulfur binding subunit
MQIEKASQPPATSHQPLATRRDFLASMGALGLTGLAAGCIRMPEERLAPYAHRPASRKPGVPVQYATAMEIGGVAQGLLVTCVDGRPIKIEGNPLHPLNRGATDAIAQASILELYDPDRSRGVIRRLSGERTQSSWEEFARWAKDVFKGDGKGVCILSEASGSPSVAEMRARLLKKMPEARWLEFEPLQGGLARRTYSVSGESARAVLELSKAKVVVSIDADLFGGGDPLAIKYARDFAAGRRPRDEKDGAMSRLYVVESARSITGACADDRRALRPSAIEMFVVQLAHSFGLVPEIGEPDSGIDKPFLQQLKADLDANRGRSVVVVGPSQDNGISALAAAINQKLANVGRTVVYYPAPRTEWPLQVPTECMIHELEADPRDTLVILGGNPAYYAPDAYFCRALRGIQNSVHLSPYEDETSLLCQWHLSQSHFLEAWGDARSYDGTLSIVQPLIEPLFDGRSAIEVLAMIAGDPAGTEGGGYEIVRRTFRSLPGAPFSEWKWKKALADGIVDGTAWKPATLEPLPPAALAQAIGTLPPPEDYELVFFTDGKVYDGRFANNGWLQELPDPMTRLTWGNAALVNPATAERLGVESDDVVALEADGIELRVPVLVLPGVADGVIGLPLGYGRTAAGRIGNGVGQNAYALRTSDSMGWRSGVKVRPTGEKRKLATVQDHHIIDRAGKEALQERIPELVHEVTVEELNAKPQAAERSAKSIFDEHRLDGGVAGDADAAQVPAHDRHRWGMTIDLSACTGCGACVVACQAENNIPIVGKEQVLLGREMHWLRVDRYFLDGPATSPQPPATTRHQPVLCMQCENAPCEEVCPFGATTHSQEGLNMMTYNRCVGTRYCSNNCPYKVRRFNFFDYNRGTLKDLYTPNLLRRPISEMLKMQKNPDVTVRMRGVMEKCTYCIQRIQTVRIAAKREGDRPIADGEIRTACQQCCPTAAIVFGDLNDPASRVSELVGQTYGLLDEELNTKPRTRYLPRVRNPAPGLD